MSPSRSLRLGGGAASSRAVTLSGGSLSRERLRCDALPPVPSPVPPLVRITAPVTHRSIVEPSMRVELVAAVESSSASVAVRWSSDDVDVTDVAIVATSAESLWLVLQIGRAHV